MQFTLNCRHFRAGFFPVLSALLVLAILCASAPSSARADGLKSGESAYVAQLPISRHLAQSLGNVAVPVSPASGPSVGTPMSYRPSPTSPQWVPPQATRNIAYTLEIGSYNRVTQVQAGKDDHSAVGILGGKYNNVGVLQAGNSLRSNLMLINTTGLSVGVIQPNGSAPVNMLIARLPNGTLLIRR